MSKYKALAKHDLLEEQRIAAMFLQDIVDWGGDMQLSTLEEWVSIVLELHSENHLLEKRGFPRLHVLQGTHDDEQVSAIWAWVLIDWLLEDEGGEELSLSVVRALQKDGAEVRG